MAREVSPAHGGTPPRTRQRLEYTPGAVYVRGADVSPARPQGCTSSCGSRGVNSPHGEFRGSSYIDADTLALSAAWNKRGAAAPPRFPSHLHEACARGDAGVGAARVAIAAMGGGQSQSDGENSVARVLRTPDAGGRTPLHLAAAAGGTGRLLRLLLLELAQTGTGAWAVDPRVGDARGLSPACLVPPVCTGALSLLRGVEHCWAYGTAASAGACAWAVTKRELRDFAVRALLAPVCRCDMARAGRFRSMPPELFGLVLAYLPNF